MNKLREKLLKAIQGMVIRKGMNEITDECEQITDDFSVKLIEWLNENADFFHGENQYHYANKWFTPAELLQIFKKNIYGKE